MPSAVSSEHDDTECRSKTEWLDEGLMIEDERHIERDPHRKPLQAARHDHQNDEGQGIPGIDRCGNQE